MAKLKSPCDTHNFPQGSGGVPPKEVAPITISYLSGRAPPKLVALLFPKEVESSLKNWDCPKTGIIKIKFTKGS